MRQADGGEPGDERVISATATGDPIDVLPFAVVGIVAAAGIIVAGVRLRKNRH